MLHGHNVCHNVWQPRSLFCWSKCVFSQVFHLYIFSVAQRGRDRTLLACSLFQSDCWWTSVYLPTWRTWKSKKIKIKNATRKEKRTNPGVLEEAQPACCVCITLTMHLFIQTRIFNNPPPAPLLAPHIGTAGGGARVYGGPFAADVWLPSVRGMEERLPSV